MRLIKLENYIKNNKLTKSVFAENVGISRNHLHRIITGKANASVPVAKTIEQNTNGSVCSLEVLRISIVQNQSK